MVSHKITVSLQTKSKKHIRYEDCNTRWLYGQSRRPTGIKKADLEELLATSDVISLHCPLTDATRYSVNRTPSSHLFEVVNVLFCQFIKFSTRLTFSHCRQSLGIWLIVERFMQKPLYQVVDTPMLPFCLGFQTL